MIILYYETQLIISPASFHVKSKAKYFIPSGKLLPLGNWKDFYLSIYYYLNLLVLLILFTKEDPNGLIYGDRCECDNLSCPKDPENGEICGGSGRLT